MTNGVANVVVNDYFWFFWVEYASDDEWSFDSVDLNELVVPYNSADEEEE